VLSGRHQPVKLRSRWLIGLAAFLGAMVLRAWLRTVRARVTAADARTDPIGSPSQRFIYAFWHESLLAPAKVKTRVKVLVSQSADGELIAQVCRHLGIGVVRGSPARGGAKGLLELLRNDDHAHLAITPDGPRGPRRRLKAGIVFLASHTGLPIVPVGIGFTRAWRAKSWDKFVIPCPFSTVTGVLAEPIVVPPQLDSEGIERHRLEIEAALLKATQSAQQWAERIASGSTEEEAACSDCIRDTESSTDPPSAQQYPSSEAEVSVAEYRLPRYHTEP